MNGCIEKMDETYKNKYYPQGSVLEKMAGASKRGNITLAVMSALVSVLLGALDVWLISLTLSRSGQGDGDAVQIGIIFVVVVTAFLALCLFGMVFGIRHIKDGVGGVVKGITKRSGLSEAEIREFDRQAMQSDSCVLTLAGKVSAAMAGQKDGILTRDYIWLGDSQNCVLKRENIIAASLYHWYYYVNKKRMSSLNLALLDRSGEIASVEVQEAAGRELMKALAEADPTIQVHEGILEEGKEYDQWRETLLGK